MSRIDSEDLREMLGLYFIMGSMNCRTSPHETLEKAISGGITMFQFREKGRGMLQRTAAYDLGKELREICRIHQVPFIVNDDLDLAIALNADGIHVGQEDAPAQWIRREIGEDKIVGVSAHTLAEAQSALADGADYLGVGPVYPTRSKEDAQAASGTSILTELRQHGITVPIVGIGGITAQNAAPVLTAGADGISVISAIAQAEDAECAARELKCIVEKN